MRNFGFALILLIATNVAAQSTNINYKEDTTDFPNPERGFYIPIGTSASHFKPLNAAALIPLFHTEHRQGKAHYTIHSTLLMREYTLDTFTSKPLSQAFLDALDRDLHTIREAGIKTILRFAYIDRTKTGDCPDVYHICPPYGDAPKAIVLQHIAQLKPLLQNNADVIAVLQEGFIGVWGENFYTDYFGDPGKNGPGRIMDSSWNDRNDVLNALLDALPADRMIQVRTPQIKQKAVYGPGATIDSKPIAASQAFNASAAARLGFHNDCFLASPDDYGTYYDYGSTNTPQKEANAPLRQYLQADSRYVPVGGETCDDAFSPQNDCSPAGHAEQEIASMHYSFLNSGYNNDVNNDWDSLGCMSSIRRRLGYRFVLKAGRFPATAAAGKPFSFTVQLDNAGYASPYNPRPVVLVFRNKTTGKEVAVATHADPRTWFSGSNNWSESLTLPADLPAGKYELLLSLPDPYASLAANPQYHLRLANKDAWEPATGYNRLAVNVVVH
ncbi:MAG TPA: DUF4832 domain-containing protein [Puia sp.]